MPGVVLTSCEWSSEDVSTTHLCPALGVTSAYRFMLSRSGCWASQVEGKLASVTAELVNVSSPTPASDEVAMLRKSLTKVQKSLAAAQQKVRAVSDDNSRPGPSTLR